MSNRGKKQDFGPIDSDPPGTQTTSSTPSVTQQLWSMRDLFSEVRESIQSGVQQPKPQAPTNKPKPVDPSSLPEFHPVRLASEPSPVLGFGNRKEFRDATRTVAEQHRDSKVIVSGSSVTGRSFHQLRKSFGDHSDIDIGVVVGRSKYESLYQDYQIDEGGFPEPDSSTSDFEKRFQRGFTGKTSTGGRRKTGIKYFGSTPNRPLYQRPHTPPPQRRKK